MRGKSIALSPARRFIGDLLHAASQVPTVPVQRRMRLAGLLAARAACPERIPWSALFMRAYARVAGVIPELRRAYVKFPWPHLYEYPVSVVSLAVEREHAGERVVFFGRIKDPARLGLVELAQAIRGFQEVPVNECKEFRRVLRVSRLPRFLRRALWWLGLNIGRQRANYFGTFALTVYSALGAESLHPLSPSTTTLNYGVIAPDGQVDVRLIYDHRVMDGATVARALGELELELTTRTVSELRSLMDYARQSA